jgi:hypothetical protein
MSIFACSRWSRLWSRLWSGGPARGLAGWAPPAAGMVVAMVGWLSVGLVGCGDDAAPPAEPLPMAAAAKAVVVAGDFNATGVLSVVDPSSLSVRRNVVAAAAGADPVIRHFGKELFVVNRFGPTGSSVTVLDASTLEVTHQLSTGTNSNPQDVAVIDGVLYLPALDTRGVVVVQRNGLHSVIDLSALDPDGRPDCVSAYAVGSKLLVVCGLLSNFTAVRDAKVVIYDTVDGSMRTAALAARNPVGFLQPTPADSVFAGDLLIATADFGAPTAQCVARINPETGESRCAVQNEALGGIANHYEISPDQTSLLITPTHYEGFELRGALRAVGLINGAVGAAPITTSSTGIADFAGCPDGSVVVADTTFGKDGIRVFRDGVELTSAPLPIGLPPSTQNGIVCY